MRWIAGIMALLFPTVALADVSHLHLKRHDHATMMINSYGADGYENMASFG